MEEDAEEDPPGEGVDGGHGAQDHEELHGVEHTAYVVVEVRFVLIGLLVPADGLEGRPVAEGPDAPQPMVYVYQQA